MFVGEISCKRRTDDRTTGTTILMLQWQLDAVKATPNKFPVSRPDFRDYIIYASGIFACGRAVHFPLFHYKIVSYYLPETAEKSAQKHVPFFQRYKINTNLKLVPI